ncbi:hypothetical protein GCM10009416_11250 [Craurococcus roseus]|uniref:Uncharacterized protein n=1 Tax=Craurococcus roseus TaxID=77585 RepID=A0ABP3PYM5_9PROT
MRAPLPAGAAASAGARLRRLDARAPGLLPLAFFALGAERLHVFESTRKMAVAAGQVAHAVTAEEEPAGEDEATCGGSVPEAPCAALAAD